MSNDTAIRGVIVRAADLFSAPVGDEVAMFSRHTGQYFCLNATAKRIWEMIENPQTVPEICRMLQREYEVDPATCECDVTGILRDFLQQGVAYEPRT